MNDILVKSGVGKYRPLINDVPGAPVNSTYTLVRVLETNKGRLYEIISNRCQRVKITEEKLRGLCAIGSVGGVFVTDDEIKICDGVVIENRVYPENVVIESTDTMLSEDAEAVESEEACSEEEVKDMPDVTEPQSLEAVFSGLDDKTEETEKTVEKKDKSKKTTSSRKK